VAGGVVLIATVITVLVVVALVLLSGEHQPQPSNYADALAEMPEEIATATLVMSEDRRILTGQAGRFRLNAKPDQVFLTVDGRLICVENKSRSWFATYPYDLIELSVQRLALQQSRTPTLRHAMVADYGYVRVVNRGTGRSRYIRVDLMDQVALEGLAERYDAIRKRRLQPTAQKNPRACQSCQYASTCQVRAVG
jgi:hypothetical protein